MQSLHLHVSTCVKKQSGSWPYIDARSSPPKAQMPHGHSPDARVATIGDGVQGYAPRHSLTLASDYEDGLAHDHHQAGRTEPEAKLVYRAPSQTTAHLFLVCIAERKHI
jgi:hypothetical protein